MNIPLRTAGPWHMRLALGSALVPLLLGVSPPA
jgi:hypothetical protein